MTQPWSLLRYSHGSGLLRPEQRRGRSSRRARGTGDLLISCMQNPLAFTLACAHGLDPASRLCRGSRGVSQQFRGVSEPQLPVQGDRFVAYPLRRDRNQPWGAGSIHRSAGRRAFLMKFYPNSNTRCLTWVKRPHGGRFGGRSVVRRESPPCCFWGGAGAGACEASFSGG